MLFQILAVHEEDVNEKTGEIKGHAAVGPNADAFAPPAATEFVFVKQIPPSKFPVFSPTDSKTHSMDFEMAYTAPPETSLPSLSAGRIKAEDKILPRRGICGGGVFVM